MKIERVIIKNYRTLEDLDIQINTFYTAVCGKNNAGKSCLIQVIKNILGFEANPFEDYDETEVSHKDDYTIWKEDKTEPILFCLEIKLFSDNDAGLIKFIETFVKAEEAQVVPKEDTNILRISLIFNCKKSIPDEEVFFNEKKLDDYSSREVMSKIRNSKTLIFHDSTETRRNYGRFHGYYDDFSVAEGDSIRQKSEILQKEIRKISERQQKDLSDLLGRLREKYDINLSVPGLSFEKIPYEISLGEKDFDIPLDNWGSGTKNRTLILKSLFNAKKFIETADPSKKITPIVLIEEPESFLHPSAQAEFGKLLQDLATEFKIQILITTHSPFLLSNLDDPTSNILLERKIEKKKLRETVRVSTNGPDWKKPFALALGIEGNEFDSIKNAFFSQSKKLLLVEGETDKEYLEMLRGEQHGKNKLDFDGEIYAYGGWSTLNNTVMMKFLKEKYIKLVLTFDLDAYGQVRKSLESLGLEIDKDYFKIGLDKGGKRSIEGLLPDSVFSKVWGANHDLVLQILSDNKTEAESAKNNLKRLYLDEFKLNAKPGNEYFQEFYKLSTKLNKALKD